MAAVSMLLKSHFNFVVFYYFPQIHDVALVSEQLSDPSFHLDNPADGDWVWCLPPALLHSRVNRLGGLTKLTRK